MTGFDAAGQKAQGRPKLETSPMHIPRPHRLGPDQTDQHPQNFKILLEIPGCLMLGSRQKYRLAQGHRMQLDRMSSPHRVASIPAAPDKPRTAALQPELTLPRVATIHLLQEVGIRRQQLVGAHLPPISVAWSSGRHISAAFSQEPQLWPGCSFGLQML